MEETYNLKAIILNRRPFAEDDSRVVVYSRERGKLDLVARGVKKIKSKLAGHLEPLSLTDIMVVGGRQYDYAGAAVSENCYFNIKSDLAKLAAAGQAVKIFDKLIKPGVADEAIFDLLKDYLEALNFKKSGFDVLNSFFIFKLLVALGFRPELYNCVNCGGKIRPVGIKFDLARGGLVCGKCLAKSGLTIGENSVKLLRLAEKNDLQKIVNIKINKKTEAEVINIVSSFLSYYHF